MLIYTMHFMKSESGLPNEFLEYCIKPKQFVKAIAKYNGKNVNPLYSNDSLKKYFHLPVSKVDALSRIRIMQPKKREVNLSKAVTNFLDLQQKLKKQQKNSVKLKKKINIFEKCNDSLQNYLSKIKSGTEALFEEDTEPWVDMKIQRGIIEHDHLMRKKQSYRSLSQFKKDKSRLHQENILQHLKIEEQWDRYGVSLEVEDKEKLIQKSLQRANKLIRKRSKTFTVEHSSPTLKVEKVDENLLIVSKDYIKKKLKTSRF